MLRVKTSGKRFWRIKARRMFYGHKEDEWCMGVRRKGIRMVTWYLSYGNKWKVIEINVNISFYYICYVIYHLTVSTS